MRCKALGLSTVSATSYQHGNELRIDVNSVVGYSAFKNEYIA